MFNDILTGKATLEPKPTNGPYREPEVPIEARRCATCNQVFSVPAPSTVTTCASCQLARAQWTSGPANYNFPHDIDCRPKRDYTFVYIRIALAIMAAIAAAVSGGVYH